MWMSDTCFLSLGHNCCQPTSSQPAASVPLLTVKGKQRQGYWREGGQEGKEGLCDWIATPGGKERTEMVEERGRKRERERERETTGWTSSEQQTQTASEQMRKLIMLQTRRQRGLCVKSLQQHSDVSFLSNFWALSVWSCSHFNDYWIINILDK